MFLAAKSFWAFWFSRSGDAEPGARIFVWGIWGLMTLIAVGFVARFGTNVPVWDDENLVPVLAGVQPLTPAWLWEQTNEHRVPLPKLILLGIEWSLGRDLRAGMFLTLAVLAALAAGLIALLGRFAGGPMAADAVVPILLLHPGHATNLLWNNQFAIVFPSALATAFLIPIAGRSGWLGVGSAWAAGLTLACLPLCGGNGLAFVPALVVWLLGSALVQWRGAAAGSRRRAGAIALATVPGVFLVALYLRGFRPGVHPPAPGGWADMLRTAVQFLVGGVGVPASWAWPWSGVVAIGLLAVALGSLLTTWKTRPRERARVFGLLAFLVGVLSAALAVGWGRGWAGDHAGFQDRYVTLATPFWCWLVVAIRLGAPNAWGRGLANLLFGLSCWLAWPNAELGLTHGRAGVEQATTLTRDIQRGMPPYQVIRNYSAYLHPNSDRLGQLLPILRAGRIGPFTALRDDPAFRAIPLAVEPQGLSMVRWQGTRAEVIGVDPQIVFALPRPMYVAGIRIRYAHANLQGAPARFVATWKNLQDRGSQAEGRSANWNLPTGPDHETTIWVDATIDQFQIQPDNQPGTFRFDEITLLVPASR